MLWLLADLAAEALGAEGALSALTEGGIEAELEGGKITVPVSSSFIEAIGYEPKSATLTVTMIVGSEYTYPGTSMGTASSPGSFYNDNIKLDH